MCIATVTIVILFFTCARMYYSHRFSHGKHIHAFHTQVDNIPDDTTVILIKFSAAPSISQQAIAEVS